MAVLLKDLLESNLAYNELVLLTRAYYRTGQLSEASWLYIQLQYVCMKPLTGLHVETKADVGAALLAAPRVEEMLQQGLLSPETSRVMHLYRHILRVNCIVVGRPLEGKAMSLLWENFLLARQWNKYKAKLTTPPEFEAFISVTAYLAIYACPLEWKEVAGLATKLLALLQELNMGAFIPEQLNLIYYLLVSTKELIKSGQHVAHDSSLLNEWLKPVRPSLQVVHLQHLHQQVGGETYTGLEDLVGTYAAELPSDALICQRILNIE